MTFDHDWATEAKKEDLPICCEYEFRIIKIVEYSVNPFIANDEERKKLSRTNLIY